MLTDNFAYRIWDTDGFVVGCGYLFVFFDSRKNMVNSKSDGACKLLKTRTCRTGSIQCWVQGYSTLMGAVHWTIGLALFESMTQGPKRKKTCKNASRWKAKTSGVIDVVTM